jgi:hypothetical protein
LARTRKKKYQININFFKGKDQHIYGRRVKRADQEEQADFENFCRASSEKITSIFLPTLVNHQLSVLLFQTCAYLRATVQQLLQTISSLLIARPALLLIPVRIR